MGSKMRTLNKRDRARAWKHVVEVLEKAHAVECGIYVC